MKFDLHVHTHHSFDSVSRVDRILDSALKTRLAGLAITDHGTLAGAQEAQMLCSGIPKYKEIVLVSGAEIKTEFDDVLALFISEMPIGNTFGEVYDSVKGQGGILAIPHPFKAFTPNPQVVRKADVIETFNARIPWQANTLAQRLAKQYSKPAIGDSDAHFPQEVGLGYTVSREFSSPEELKKIILSGKTKPEGKPTARKFKWGSWALGKYSKATGRNIHWKRK
jgi:predicted metal-dependent phosphoesterase TrpH